MEKIGTHCILEMFGCDASRLDDLVFTERTLQEAATFAGATWLGMVSHKFQPQGVPALGLLAESHVSIHTWPEDGYAAVDVFTCGDVAMPHKAAEYILNAFKSTSSKMTQIDRTKASPISSGAANRRPVSALR